MKDQCFFVGRHVKAANDWLNVDILRTRIHKVVTTKYTMERHILISAK